MSLPKLSGSVLWLLPDKRSSALLHGQILSLSGIFQSEPFLPHITLSRVAGELPLAVARDKLQQLAAGTRAFPISMKSIQCRENPYQKIVLEAEGCPPISDLAERAGQLLDQVLSPPEFPHLSLLYSHVSCARIEQELSRLNLEICKKLYIQYIALVRLESIPSEWKPVVLSPFLE